MKGRQLFAVVALLAVLAAICLPAYRVLRDAVAAAPHASVGQQLLPGAPYRTISGAMKLSRPRAGRRISAACASRAAASAICRRISTGRAAQRSRRSAIRPRLKGGTLRLSNAGPFPANFLAFGQSSPQFFHYNCFTTVAVPLVATHPMTGRSIPGVAEAWATRGRSVWFRLHPAARYSNGRPVRAGGPTRSVRT